jgi:cation transport regulator ChaB
VFEIIAWDVTINKLSVKEKLKKFWLAFNQFKDKFKRRLNESTKTQLSYIILMAKK